MDHWLISRRGIVSRTCMVALLGSAVFASACSSDSDDDGTSSTNSSNSASGGSGASGASNTGASGNDGGAGVGAGNVGGSGVGASGGTGATGGSGATGGTGGGGGSGGCQTTEDCNDNDSCTTDTCKQGACGHDVLDPDDNNACTTDTCDAQTGVAHAPIDRNDMDACTLDSCDPAVGPVNVAETVLFSEDFSDNSAGWVLGTEWAIGPAVVSSGANQGGEDPAQDHTQAGDNGVAGVVIGGFPAKTVHGFYYLESPAIDTSGAAAGSYVELRLWRFLSSDYDPYMHSDIEVYDGANWITVWTTADQLVPTLLVDNIGPGHGNGWFPMSFDVTAYANAGFKVRVGFDIGGTNVYTIGSWTVDDVSVVTAPFATDADQCTVATCDPQSGSSFGALAIQDDGFACTAESCTTNEGVYHTPDDALCDDGNVCTNDDCDVTQGCVNTPIGIDDGNACTADACDPVTGESHTLLDCNDNNACTTDSCDPAIGCGYVAVTCGDGNQCTADSCNPATGCVFAPQNQPHDKCATGVSLLSGCAASPSNTIINSICAADGFCCNNSWDTTCVGEVLSVGNSAACAGTCAHAACVVGAKLTTGCNSCVTSICAVDSFCCTNSWDSACVSEVATVCAKTCN